MDKNKEIASKVEHSLFSGWKAAKPDHTFYSTTCRSTPPGTPSPFARSIEEKRKKQCAEPANNIQPRAFAV